MSANDVTHFARLMAGLSELYGKTMTSALIDIYWVALKQFDMAAISQALTAHINNPDVGHYMPKPADVRRYIEGNSITQALQAWSKVVNAIKQVGPYETLVFDDPVIHVVIMDMGGWVELCKITDKELPFRRQEFEKRYSGYLLRKPHKYPKQLTGIAAHQNQLSNYRPKPPVLCGNPTMACQIFKEGEEMSAFNQYQVLPLENTLKQLASAVAIIS